jgi:hypothetical protein
MAGIVRRGGASRPPGEHRCARDKNLSIRADRCSLPTRSTVEAIKSNPPTLYPRCGTQSVSSIPPKALRKHPSNEGRAAKISRPPWLGLIALFQLSFAFANLLQGALSAPARGRPSGQALAPQANGSQIRCGHGACYRTLGKSRKWHRQPAAKFLERALCSQPRRLRRRRNGRRCCAVLHPNSAQPPCRPNVGNQRNGGAVSRAPKPAPICLDIVEDDSLQPVRDRRGRATLFHNPYGDYVLVSAFLLAHGIGSGHLYLCQAVRQPLFLSSSLPPCSTTCPVFRY